MTSNIKVNDNETLKSLIKTCFLLDNPPPLLKNANLKELKANAHFNLGKEYSQIGQVQKALSEISITISILEDNIPNLMKKKGGKGKKEKKQSINSNSENPNSNIESNKEKCINQKELLSDIELLNRSYQLSKDLYESLGKTLMVQNMEKRLNKLELYNSNLEIKEKK